MVDTKSSISNAQSKVANTANSPKRTGGGKTKVPIWIWIGGGVIVLLFIGMLIMFAVSKGKKDEENLVGEQEVASTANVTGQSAVVYDQSEREREAEANTNNGLATAVDYSKELSYFNDPTTGVRMVDTPTGPLVAESAEGQAYIRDYEAKRAEWLANNQNAQQASQQTQNDLQQQNIAQQQTIAELQQSNVNLSAELEQIKELTKSQTEALEVLASTIKKTQPIFNNYNQNQKNAGSVVLKGKHKTVDVLAIQGDRAWLDVNGEIKSYTVGDTLPGNKKIRLIDPSGNKVIVQ